MERVIVGHLDELSEYNYDVKWTVINIDNENRLETTVGL